MSKPLAETLSVKGKRAYQVPRRLATSGATTGEDLLKRCGSGIDFLAFEKFYRQERNLPEGMHRLGSFSKIIAKLLIYCIVLVLKSKYS